MSRTIAIRKEDKYLMERRAPVTPAHVAQLCSQGLRVLVESSSKRVFSDEEYLKAGAEIVSELGEADIILGVKEMPLDIFLPGKTYVFFSHTIKGQSYNMPLLKRMMEQKVNLIDYERIVDAEEKRLIFFGRYAGIAGMINSLWSLGQRMEIMGVSNPFTRIKQSHQYDSLDDAVSDVKLLRRDIETLRLPEWITPLTVGVTGYGNVSKGAQEILDMLPVKEITPGQLLSLKASGDYSDHVIYKCVFAEKDLSQPLEQGKAFDLNEYYQHPDRFESQFDQYIPHLTVLMNCMYWDDRYPRIVTKSFLKNHFEEDVAKLLVIGDVTCDPDGSIECTHKGTLIEDPVFVYDPLTDSHQMGFSGEGVLIMAVDILPSELPREASQTFSDALLPFLPSLAETDFDDEFAALKLPDPLKQALILKNGKLTPGYQYLMDYLK